MNATEDNSVEFKRRAVYTGLRTYLGQDALMEAMCHWQKDFSDKPKFAISRFISHLVNQYDLGTQRTEIQSKMARLMMAASDTLDEDPLPQMLAYQDGNKVATSADKPRVNGHRHEAIESLMFRMFVDELAQVLRTRDAMLIGLMIETLNTRLSTIGLNGAEANQLEEWLQDRRAHMPVDLGKDKLHDLLIAVYVMLCEKFGPVETDRIYGTAVRKVEQSDAAGGQSPRILL